MDNFSQKFTQLYFELVFFHNQTKSQPERIHRAHLAYVLKRAIPEIREKEDLIKSLGDINRYLQVIIDENTNTDILLNEAIKEQNNTNTLITEIEKLISKK